MNKYLLAIIFSICMVSFVGVFYPSTGVISLSYASEATPTTNPGQFESVRGASGKKNKITGEIWELDRLHKNHWEVYKNKKHYDKGKRDRAVWNDGRLKERF